MKSHQRSTMTMMVKQPQPQPSPSSPKLNATPTINRMTTAINIPPAISNITAVLYGERHSNASIDLILARFVRENHASFIRWLSPGGSVGIGSRSAASCPAGADATASGKCSQPVRTGQECIYFLSLLRLEYCLHLLVRRVIDLTPG